MSTVRKKLYALLLTTCMIASLSGCKKNEGPTKEELQNQVNTMISGMVSKDEQIKTLKQMLAVYNPSLAEVQDLGNVLTLAASEGAFINLNDRIYINNDIVIEPSTAVQNQTLLNITDSIKIRPSSNWSIQVGNGTLKLNHPNGVYGEINCYKFIGQTNGYECFTTFVQPHLDAIKAERIGTVDKIFFADGNVAGAKQTSRLRVATLRNNEKHIEEEIMTQPYEVDESGNIIVYNADGNPVTSEEETTVEETVAETVESGSEAENESEGVTQDGDSNTQEGEVAEENKVYQAGELTDEVIKQSDDDILDVENYIYTTGCVCYATDTANYEVVVLKFFHKEGDSVDATSKKEFIDSIIKSISVKGNYLTL